MKPFARTVGVSVATLLITLILAGCGGGSSTQQGPIPFGVLIGITGKYAALGTEMNNGAATATNDINKHGGVLGRSLVLYTGDTTADAVDAVPAFRQMETHNLTFIAGPTGNEFSAIQPLADAAHLPDFAFVGSPALDTNTDPFLYRIATSDSLLGTAMAFYANSKGFTNCSIIAGNDQSSQSLVPVITAAFTKHGGTVGANVVLTPHETSYRTEVLTAFAPNPQCVFIQTDPQTSGTLFAAIRELGHLNVPFIGSDAFTDPNIAKAIGTADMSKWVTGMSGVEGSGPSYDYLTNAYKVAGYTNPAPPTYYSATFYDAVVVAALTMTYAGTSDPNVWVNKVTAITNPPGQTVTNYADGVNLLKQGKKITYIGASGLTDYDSYHNIYSGFSVVQFDAAGQTLHPVAQIAAADLKSFAS